MDEKPTSNPESRRSLAESGRSRITWQAPSIPTYRHSTQWYITAGVVVLLSAIYGILTGNWLFAVILLTAAGIFYFVRNIAPPLHTITLTEQGILFDEELTRYEECGGFWFFKTSDFTELRIPFTKKKKGEIRIQTGNIEVSTIRSTLGNHLSELPLQERLLDTLSRICKI